tara:strand:+ start:63138 stop:66134 length:2997 start_codon:yes stop_codon:yes gene_type:complete
MEKLKLLLIAFCIGISFNSWAQTAEVSGILLDEQDMPIVGVNVLEKGTTNGAVTDFDGKFSLKVSSTPTTFVFSYIGFLSKEVKVDTAQSDLVVRLIEDVTGLDEIVLIGYGAAKKSDLTGAVSSLKSSDLTRANPVAVAQGVQGQVAGVEVTKSNGRPGAGYSIKIRGLSSIDYSNEPLIVIDGVTDGDLNSINPADIKSIDILKDASSTAIYGSRGANGVVIVTTKRGKTGKAVVSYNGYVGVKVPAHLPNMLNAEEFYKMTVTDRVLNGGSPRTFTSTEMASVDAGKGVDWIDEVTSPSLQTSHSVSVGGGSENVNYHFSVGYLEEGGSLDETGFKRYNIKGSMDSKLSDKFKVGFTTNYSNSNLNLGSDEVLRAAYRVRPTGVINYADNLNPSENNDLEWNGYAVWMGINDKQVLNPLVEGNSENFQHEILTSNYLGNAYIEYTPIEGLSIKSSIAARKLDERDGEYRGTYTKSQKASIAPKAYYSTRTLTTYTFDNIINYNNTFKDHSINVTAVQSAYKLRNETSSIAVEDLPYRSLWYGLDTAGTIKSVGSNLTEKTLSSYMGRFIYGYKDNRYLLTLTSRWDGASQLGDGNKWDFFPSAAVAWKISDEKFMESVSTINSMKLRLSYGVVGNSSVDPYSTQSGLLLTSYAFGNNTANGFAPSNLADKNLGWEKSKEFNFGLDFGLLDNRITSSIELYDRKTVDLIYKERVPTSIGYEEAVTNIGEVANRGIEVTLSTTNVQNDNFSWSTNVNFASNKNEVLSIGSAGVLADIGSGLFVGESLGSNYDYEFDGVWQLDEAAEAAVYNQVPGSVKVVDQNGDGKISSGDGEDDRVILGSQLPKWTMGISNKFTLKDFDLSFLVYTSQGAQYKNSMLSGTMGDVDGGRYNTLKLNYWTVDNPTNDYYGPAVANPYRSAIQYQDASFIRISDITLGYTFPSAKLEKVGLSNLRVYTQVINPFVFHDYDGMDPEYNSSTYGDDVSSATYLFGVKCTF